MTDWVQGPYWGHTIIIDIIGRGREEERMGVWEGRGQ